MRGQEVDGPNLGLKLPYDKVQWPSAVMIDMANGCIEAMNPLARGGQKIESPPVRLLLHLL